MTMKQFKNISIGLLSLVLLGSCNQRLQEGITAPGDERKLTVRFSASALGTAQNNATGTAEQLSLADIKGYHFEDGVLREVLTGEDLAQNGNYAFYPTSTTGDIYFVANAPQELFGQVQIGTTTATNFLGTIASASQLSSEQILMTGSMTLGSTSSSDSTVALHRAVARLDVVSQDSGVLLRKVTLSGIANQGYVFPQSTISSPSGTEWGDFQKEYAESGVENHTETLTYLNEQAGTPLSAEVIVSFGGGLHRMVTEFPAEIARNNVYTLRVKGSGTGVSVSVSGDNWAEGSSTDATLNVNGLVDVAASTLPEGVKVSATCDSVFVPFEGATMQLALRAAEGSQVEIDGRVDRATATLSTGTKTLASVATVAVNSARRMPNEKREYIFLNTYQENKHTGRVVLVFEPNPVQLSGEIDLNNDGMYDFARYVDGELGRITLPEGKIAKAAFDSGEDAWVKLEKDSTGEIRILGGWRPNDPTANGRSQSCRLVFSNSDGTDEESYEIRRINWGLPVVKFGGNWWCKYNLRGNATSFEDQISIQEDPAKTGSLADYLNQCDTSMLLNWLGDQYQGGYPDGLKLTHDGTYFYYDGLRASAQSFSATMAPAGYQIPNKAALSAFGASENYNLGGVGGKTFTNMLGKEVSVRIIERNVTLLGQSYGPMDFYEFSSADEDSCVLFGLGHQWGTAHSNVSKMMILFATSGVSGSTWYMEGYAQNVKANQNWWKFTANNNIKTRTIRCIKTPVEYIY